MIPLAAVVGGLTPFCSCGVIPAAAGLFGVGVPLAPVVAFWIAAPLMAQFFVIAGSLGIGFAIAKAVAAIGMGLLGGYGTMLMTRAGLLVISDALRITAQSRSWCSSQQTDRRRKAGLALLARWQTPVRVRPFGFHACRVPLVIDPNALAPSVPWSAGSVRSTTAPRGGTRRGPHLPWLTPQRAGRQVPAVCVSPGLLSNHSH
jgi:uncharacterized membrane protein YraQ (UPF0718 family)